MSRRHFGNVRKLPSGRYQASHWHEGRRYVAPDTFDAKADANAWLDLVHSEVLRGHWVDTRGGLLTVEELAKEWLGSNPAKRPDTWATDDYHIRAHITPALGQLRIRVLTPRIVQQFVTNLSERLAPATVARAHGVLRAMFANAVESDLLGRSPCRGTKLPRRVTRRRGLPTTDQVAALAEALGPEYRVMAWLGAALGLRFSEVAGAPRGSSRSPRPVHDGRRNGNP
jgi:integrase